MKTPENNGMDCDRKNDTPKSEFTQGTTTKSANEVRNADKDDSSENEPSNAALSSFSESEMLASSLKVETAPVRSLLISGMSEEVDCAKRTNQTLSESPSSPLKTAAWGIYQQIGNSKYWTRSVKRLITGGHRRMRF